MDKRSRIPEPFFWLLSSAGRRGELVKILGRSGEQKELLRVLAVDASPLSAAGVLADDLRLVPPVSEPDFVSTIVDIVSSTGVQVVIPTIDPEIAVYSEISDQLAALGARVWVSSPEVARLGFDKWHFYRWASNNGIPVPTTWEAGSSSSSLSGPVVAKPRCGSSSIGVRYFRSAVEARDAILPAEYILQERINGVEVTIDFAVGTSGRLLGYTARERLEVRAGEVSKGVTIASPLFDELMHETARLLDGAYGVLNLQVFLDRENNEVRVLELNPRFGGGYPLTHAAGGDLIGPLLADMRGEQSPFARGRVGVVLLRYDSHVTIEPPAQLPIF